ncbi:hypothetical protein Agabi119p4_6236 [Agaricus bisporus var. burnettii]|uniref:F-box domain-containing protein n=1 Tax=Agaricus bisporus var. burnettii TaxID=192524 RepID=A0A8H7C814_AGABI|nr:hypothetical protein Agabi119p4_6236 [Agaricus bisporus var. burnettii]
MGHFDEVCFLCGVAPIGPSEFTSDPDLVAEGLADALLEHFPNILSALPTCETKKELEAYLEAIFEEEDPQDFNELSLAFFRCIAIGYFDDDGNTPRKGVDDPAVKFIFPDGQFVKKRWVDDPECGEFQTVYRKNGSDTEEIDRTTLPPMWDERQLSFVGELWEIINSRKTGRKDDGCLDWLKPGGAENKLSQTQYNLTPYGEEIYPGESAAALQSGCDQDNLKRAIYDDYGYWMFVSPHEWPEAPENEDLIEVTTFGFDVPPRAFHTSSFTGFLFRFSTEILSEIFGQLPNVATYLTLKLVSKRMHDLVTDTKFAFPVLREIIKPDPTGEMFWIYPLEDQQEEMDNFKNSLYSWLTLNCSSVEMESVTTWDILSHHEFPLVHFIHALYMSDCSRNRRRLWKNVKKFEEVWVDYRRNGWEVNRFGLPYPEFQGGSE